MVARFSQCFELTTFSLSRAAELVAQNVERLRAHAQRALAADLDRDALRVRLGDLFLHLRALICSASPILIDLAASAAQAGQFELRMSADTFEVSQTTAFPVPRLSLRTEQAHTMSFPSTVLGAEMSTKTVPAATATRPRRSRATERLLLPAAFITTAGNAFQLTAASILVFRADANAVAVGWVFIAMSIPQAALALMFGRLVDRFDRRRLSVTADVASAVIALSLPVWLWTGGSHTLGSYLTTFLLACSAALFIPASNALVKERIRDERLGTFNAHFELATNAGMLIASGLAGVLFVVLGPVPLFLFNSGTFVVSAVLTSLVGRKAPAAGQAANPAAGQAAAGQAAAARPARQPIKRLALLYVNVNVGLVVASTLLLVLVLHNFHKGPWLIGVVDALAFSGFLVGAALYPKVSARVKTLPLAVLAMLINVTVWCLEPLSWIALISLIPIGGAVYAMTRIAARTLLMKASPPEQAGRIFGGAQAAGLAASVLATVFLSWLTDATSVLWAFWGLGAIQGLISIGAYLSLTRPAPAPDMQQAEVVEATA
jgi:MFS family permease